MLLSYSIWYYYTSTDFSQNMYKSKSILFTKSLKITRKRLSPWNKHCELDVTHTFSERITKKIRNVSNAFEMHHESTGTDMGIIMFYLVTFTLEFDIFFENFNLANNFWTVIPRAYIFHISIHCDKTFPWVPPPWSPTISSKH